MSDISMAPEIDKDDFLLLLGNVIGPKFGVSPELATNFLKYAMRFGHLVAPKVKDLLADLPGVIRKVRDAISLLQGFAGVEQTGRLDEQIEKIMALPRCGCAEQLMTEEARWRKNKLRWFFKSYAPGLPPSVQEDVMQACCRDWSQYADVSFDKAPSLDSADIYIFSATIDRAGAVLAQAQLPMGDDRPLFLQLGAEETWVEKNPTGIEILLRAVLEHELGHNLGLTHDNTPKQLMSPYYSPSVASAQLNDQKRLLDLYGPPFAPPTPVPGVKTLTVEINGPTATVVSYR